MAYFGRKSLDIPWWNGKGLLGYLWWNKLPSLLRNHQFLASSLGTGGFLRKRNILASLNRMKRMPLCFSNIYLLTTQILLMWWFSIFGGVTDPFETFTKTMGPIPETRIYHPQIKSFIYVGITYPLKFIIHGAFLWWKTKKEEMPNKNEV